MIREKPRIAFVIPNLRGGGVERIIVALCNGLAEKGLIIDLVLGKIEGPYLGSVSNNVHIVDLNSPRMLTSIPALVRYLRHRRPTALIGAMPHVNVVTLIARILAVSRTKIIITEHATLSIAIANVTTYRQRILGHLTRLLYPRADGIVAVSKGVADDLAKTIGISRRRIAVIYNPVVTAELKRQCREHPGDKWYDNPNVPLVLGVGRLAVEKDFPTLIRAFSLVRNRREARLAILGEGPMRGELEQLVERLGLGSDIKLPGFLSNPYSIMRRASVFVLSSAWEGFGNVLAEAMACGTPVVATSCPTGPTEILEYGRWGRLVPVGDVHGLADAIVATLEDRTHPEVEERAKAFGVEQAVMRYLNVLRAANAVDRSD